MIWKYFLRVWGLSLFFLAILGLELRASCLQILYYVSHTPIPFDFAYTWTDLDGDPHIYASCLAQMTGAHHHAELSLIEVGGRSHKFFAQDALNHGPPDRCFLSRWDHHTWLLLWYFLTEDYYKRNKPGPTCFLSLCSCLRCDDLILPMLLPWCAAVHCSHHRPNSPTWFRTLTLQNNELNKPPLLYKQPVPGILLSW
jgi:hypothetical protein